MVNHDCRAQWEGWARFLQRWGIRQPASSLLEAAGPLSIFAAQMIYLGQPFLGQNSSLRDFAHLLENKEESRSFAAFLREETNP